MTAVVGFFSCPPFSPLAWPHRHAQRVDKGTARIASAALAALAGLGPVPALAGNADTATALATAPATAPRPVITWAVQDFPPINILNNGVAPASPAELGTGVVDQLLRELTTRLPQYRHEFRLASRQRIWAAMRQGDHLCDPGAIRTTEREQWAWFTPALLMPPLALVTRADNRQQLTQGAPNVSLRALLGRDFKGGIEPSRSYGPALDPLLKQADAPAAVGTSSSSAAMLSLVALGRYDYTVDYPMVVQFVQGNRPLAAPLAVVPLREAQEWVVAEVACTRNAWGQAVLRDVDAALRAAYRSPAYRGIVTAWLPPAYYKANEQRIQAFYDSRPKATP